MRISVLVFLSLSGSVINVCFFKPENMRWIVLKCVVRTALASSVHVHKNFDFQTKGFSFSLLQQRVWMNVGVTVVLTPYVSPFCFWYKRNQTQLSRKEVHSDAIKITICVPVTKLLNILLQVFYMNIYVYLLFVTLVVFVGFQLF